MRLKALQMPLVSRKRLEKQEQLLRAAVLLLQSRGEELSRLRWWVETLSSSNYNLALAQAEEAVIEKEPQITMSNQPLYMSEQQEDIEWQYDHDMIDLKTYQALLKDLEFENSEVQLDEEYSVENFHY